MIVNFTIDDGDIRSNELYNTELSVSDARKMLDDAIILLNSAYELNTDMIDELALSDETKAALNNENIEELSGMRDDGWVTDTAVAMINFVHEKELFKLVPFSNILNYTYSE